MRSVALASVVFFSLSCTACYSVSRHSTTRDEVLSVKLDSTLVEGSQVLDVVLESPSGPTLRGSVHTQARCTEREVKIVDRTLIKHRSVKGAGWTFLVGLPASILGVGLIAAAPGFEEKVRTLSVGQGQGFTRAEEVVGTDPDVIMGIGVVSSFIGLPLLINGIAGGIEAIDRSEHLGEVRVEGFEREVLCRRAPAVGQEVALEFSTGFRFRVEVQEDGSFEVPTPPLSALLAARTERKAVRLAIGGWQRGFLLSELPGVVDVLKAYDDKARNDRRASDEARLAWIKTQGEAASDERDLVGQKGLWLPTPAAGRGEVRQVVALDEAGRRLLMLRDRRVVLVSGDEGSVWTPAESGLPASIWIVAMVSLPGQGTAWCLGSDSRVYRFEAKGARWVVEQASIPTSCVLVGLSAWQTSRRGVLVARCLDEAYFWRQGAASWSRLGFKGGKKLVDVSHVSDAGWFALLDNGELRISEDLIVWKTRLGAVPLPSSAHEARVTSGKYRWVYVRLDNGRLLRRGFSEGGWSPLVALEKKRVGKVRGLVTKADRPTLLYLLTDSGVCATLDAGESFQMVNRGLDRSQYRVSRWLGLVGKQLYSASGEQLYVQATVEEKIEFDASVLFDTGQHKLKRSARKELKELAARLIKLKGRIRIDGHTDSIGEDVKNQVLSERRARSVADFLKKAGVKTLHVVSYGHGESRPVADNDTDEGRARNRRVEVRVIAH